LFVWTTTFIAFHVMCLLTICATHMSQLQAKVDSNAICSIALSQQMSPSTTLTMSSQFDTRALGTRSSSAVANRYNTVAPQFGVSIVLEPKASTVVTPVYATHTTR
jgi:hypothetical protein